MTEHAYERPPHEEGVFLRHVPVDDDERYLIELWRYEWGMCSKLWDLKTGLVESHTDVEVQSSLLNS